MEPVATMLSYWGKVRNSDADGPPYHLLAYHSLDVAAVAAEWWEQSRVLRSQCCYTTGLEEVQTRAWVVFFIALHDYGKWDIRFQLKALHAVATPLSGIYAGYGGARLQVFSRSTGLRLVYVGRLLPPGSQRRVPLPLAAVAGGVTGHHGSLPDNPEAAVPRAHEAIIERDRTARLEWLHAIEALFLHPVGLHLEELPPPWPGSAGRILCGVRLARL